MMLAQEIGERVDLKWVLKTFRILALVPIMLIPLDALRMAFQKPAVIDSSRKQVIASPVEKSFDSLASYLDFFEKSSLFGNPSHLAGPVIHATLAELVKDYRLKGVIITEAPEAIIEDARNQKSTFVRVGQQVGDLKLQEIKEGYVVLAYLGEEVKLEIQ